MVQSKSIAFCIDCERPISAGATRCSRCAGAASRGVARSLVAAASTTPTIARLPAERRREGLRALSVEEQVAIRAADASLSHVALAWRYGVSAAEIARIRDNGA